MERDLLKDGIYKRLEEGLRYWVPLINAEFGRSDRNGYTMQWFMRLRESLCFEWTDDWYVIALPSPDMWGDITLNVLSLGVAAEKRNNPAYIRKILRCVRVFAYSANARYIEIGSHKTDKLCRILGKHGYKVSAVRKELTWEQ